MNWELTIPSHSVSHCEHDSSNIHDCYERKDRKDRIGNTELKITNIDKSLESLFNKGKYYIGVLGERKCTI